MSVSPPTTHRIGIRGSTVLVFQGAEGATPLALGVLFRDIETLYWFCVETAESDHLSLERNELPPRVATIEFGSPLEITLQLAEVVWPEGVGFLFIGALAMIFKLPVRFQEERQQFWQTRLAADQAKREWIEWTEAEYRRLPIRLDEVVLPEEAAEYLPDEGES
jgi:hypothetical protein